MKKQEQDISKIPGRENYSLYYLCDGRIFSYANQIHSVLTFKPKSVLEVGIGSGMVAGALRSVGIKVITADCQPELKPDIVSSVTEIPLKDKSVDVSLCCQVLEHLPFDNFETAIKELDRVAKKGIVLSLPDTTMHYEVRLRLPIIGFFEWFRERQYRISKEERNAKYEKAGHYWEIGYTEVQLNHIIGVIEDIGLKVSSTWRVREKPYHRFFIIETNKTEPR